MGASLVYLEKPNKDIQFEQGENGKLRFVAAGMQGWRINMVSSPKMFGILLRENSVSFALSLLLETDTTFLN